MSVIEQIIRPSEAVDVGATPYKPPGAVGVPPALVKIGLKGGGQSFTGNMSYTRDTKIGATHDETTTGSQTIQSDCGTTAQNNANTYSAPAT